MTTEQDDAKLTWLSAPILQSWSRQSEAVPQVKKEKVEKKLTTLPLKKEKVEKKLTTLPLNKEKVEKILTTLPLKKEKVEKKLTTLPEESLPSTNQSKGHSADDKQQSSRTIETVESNGSESQWLPHTLVIENQICTKKRSNSGGSDSSSKFGCGAFSKCLGNRWVIGAIIIYAIIASGLWSVFLGNPFGFGRGAQLDQLKDQVTILDGEIEELEDEVDRLGSEITRLTDETDRLEAINDALALSAKDLNETVHVLEELNNSLNISSSTQEDLNKALEESIINAKDVNDLIVDSISNLDERVTNIANLNLELRATTEKLEAEKEEFIELTNTLEESNLGLAADLEELKRQNEEFQAQNEELSKNNNDLRSILEFLNQAGLDLNATVQGIAEYLADEIAENNALVLRDLELSYQNEYYFWVCRTSFEQEFRSARWVADETTPIGADDYHKVIQFVDDNVLGKICADKSDFENFLVSDSYINYQGTSPPVDISLITLKSGIERYSTSMMEYYFNPDNAGLKMADWTDARFDCANIPLEKRYVWERNA